MVIVKCQHSNIEFEAKTKRTKQHPKIADLKSAANKNGNYREVNNALDSVQKAGGYNTIEEYMTRVYEVLEGNSRKRDEQKARQREASRQAEIAKQERLERRKQENETLKANGYTWEKEAVGTEDGYLGHGAYSAGVGEFSHNEWTLYAPNGRIVTVERALAEIKFGVEFVQAEEDAYAEDKRRTERKEAEVKAQAENTYRQAVQEAKQYLEVADIDYATRKTFESIARVDVNSYGAAKGVTKGQVNGVACYEVWQVGDMDMYRYYCSDPEKAGLTRKQETKTDDPLGLNATFNAIWDDDDEGYF